MPRLDLHNISLAFSSTKTVAHASLTTEAVKVVVLIGANGAFEPILARNLFGLYRPGAGKTLCRDNENAPENPADATASGGVAVRQSTDMVGISSLAVMTALPPGPAAPLHAPHHLGHRIRRWSAQRPHRVEYHPFYAQDPIKRIAWAKN